MDQGEINVADGDGYKDKGQFGDEPRGINDARGKMKVVA
jgi:hypothetical protein